VEIHGGHEFFHYQYLFVYIFLYSDTLSSRAFI
jgi:hypothetical protein